MQSAQTVNDVLDWYAKHEARERPGAGPTERQRQRKLFRERYGSLSLDECRPFHLLEFIDSQALARSNHTRRRIKASVCTPFNAAAEVRLIDANPFRGVKIPKGKTGRDMTKEEYQSLLRATRPYFKRLLVFMRFSGMRPGEVRTLKWEEIREELECIVKAEHKTRWATDEARRIPFNPVLVKLIAWLRRHREDFNAHNVPLFAHCPPPHDFVFTNGYGQRWTSQALTKHLRMIRKRVGLSPEVKLHSARHMFCTSALMNGVDVFALMELLGHKSIKTTQGYVHLLHKREYLNAAMSRAIGRPVPTNGNGKQGGVPCAR
jgi:integrase